MQLARRQISYFLPAGILYNNLMDKIQACTTGAPGTIPGVGIYFEIALGQIVMFIVFFSF